MNKDPEIAIVAQKYIKIFITEVVQLFSQLDVDKTPQQLIQLIQEKLIPNLKNKIDVWKQKTELYRIKLQSKIQTFNYVKVNWTDQDIENQLSNFLDQTYKLLNKQTIQSFLIKNMRIVVDAIFSYCCELYQMTYGVIQDGAFQKNDKVSQFDDILKDVVDPQQTYDNIISGILGKQWQGNQTGVNIYNNKINFKNVFLKVDMDVLKSNEIKLFMKHYKNFFDLYHSGFLKTVEKLLPQKILNILPVSIDLLLEKPGVITAIGYYIFDCGGNGGDFVLTQLLCSKEFMKIMAIAKKIFSQETV